MDNDFTYSVCQFPADLQNVDYGNLLQLQMNEELELTPETLREAVTLKASPQKMSLAQDDHFEDRGFPSNLEILESPLLSPTLSCVLSPGSENSPYPRSTQSPCFQYLQSHFQHPQSPCQYVSRSPYQQPPQSVSPAPPHHPYPPHQQPPQSSSPAPVHHPYPPHQQPPQSASPAPPHHSYPPQTSAKSKLKLKIQTMRPELKVEFVHPKTEVLSAHDLEKREERKRRNKVAATRCREKKRAKNDVFAEQAKCTERENELLRKKIEELERENDEFKTHLLHCPLHSPLLG